MNRKRNKLIKNEQKEMKRKRKREEKKKKKRWCQKRMLILHQNSVNKRMVYSKNIVAIFSIFFPLMIFSICLIFYNRKVYSIKPCSGNKILKYEKWKVTLCLAITWNGKSLSKYWRAFLWKNQFNTSYLYRRNF